MCGWTARATRSARLRSSTRREVTDAPRRARVRPWPTTSTSISSPKAQAAWDLTVARTRICPSSCVRGQERPCRSQICGEPRDGGAALICERGKRCAGSTPAIPRTNPRVTERSRGRWRRLVESPSNNQPFREDSGPMFAATDFLRRNE